MPEIIAVDGAVTVIVHGSEKYIKILHYGQIGEIGADGIDRRREDKKDPRKNQYIIMQEVLSRELKDREKKLLMPLVEYLAENDEVTASKAGEIINRSASTATRYLNKLIDLNVLVRIGGSYNTVYALK